MKNSKKFNNNSINKWEIDPKRYFSNEEIQMTNKYMIKMSSIFTHQGNAKQNNTEISTPCSELSSRKQK
jgi:hypothetical protein